MSYSLRTGLVPGCLVFLATWLCPGFAETPPAQHPTAASLEITNIQAVSTEKGVDVEISGTAALTGTVTVLENPPRIAVDIPVDAPRAEYRRIPVQKSGVTAIRESLFRTNPPTLRVVVDLEKPAAHQLISQGNKLILQIGSVATSGPPAAIAAAPPKVAPAPAASNSPPPPTSKPPVALASNVPLHPNETPKNSPSPGTTASPSTLALRGLSIVRQPDGMVVKAELSGPIKPLVSALSNPERIVVDFPNTLPGTAPRRLAVHQDGIQTVRLGLFQENPPITRVVLEVESAKRPPKISLNANDVVIQPVEAGSASGVAANAVNPRPPRVSRVAANPPARSVAPTAAAVSQHLAAAAQPTAANSPSHSAASAAPAPSSQPAPEAAGAEVSGITPQKPKVIFQNGLLTIDAENSTMADILYEVSSQTGAQVDMPMAEGAFERVVAKLGPGNPRDVMTQLLQGSSFTYLIVESPTGLQKIILTPKTAP
ncbi:MAG TPA: AMIN domain-containing protein [Terriglobales bacterium]|nr:AMIN domain-containing protein [Terriglobales bacterium]